MKEYRVRGTSIPENQRDGPGDGRCGSKRRSGGLPPRTGSSARIAVYGVA